MDERSSKYWQERFRQMENAQHDTSVQKVQEIQEQFDRSLAAIDGKINAWYQRLADNNGVSMQEARKMLDAGELKEFRWNVEEYTRYAEENEISGAWAKQLENASAQVHISRLEALKIETQQEVEKLYGNCTDAIDHHIRDTYTSDFYHTAFEVQKGIGVGTAMNRLDPETVEKIVSKPWAVDGKNFSDRLWENKTKLINNMHNSLSRMCITGEAPDRAIAEISKQMGVSKAQAGRVVMTESAAFANKARQDCMEELDVEQFEVVETLDSHTCETCGGMDGKHFSMREFEVGVTAPPFHPNCRGCTCPYFDDEFDSVGERAARGEDGKTYYVPADTTYEKWFEQYVKSSPQEMLAYTKAKSLDSDKKQYKKYKERLGKSYLPSTFDEFQNIKYGNAKEYGILKSQYKGMKYYNKAVESEPLITSSVKDVAENCGLETYGLKNRIKGKESYLRKIRAEYKPDGNKYEVKDIVRYTLGTDDAGALVKGMENAIDELSKLGYNTIAVKNSWEDPLNPYKGINTTVIAPNGQKFEIQYHTKESFEVKEKMHALYEKQRMIEDQFSNEYIKLSDEMFELSNRLSEPSEIERVKSYGK